MTDREMELHRFTMDVMYNVALNGDLASVTNNVGEHPCVACLDDEPLGDVLARVEAAGGFATVFCRGVCDPEGGYLVRIAHFIDEACALSQGAEDMTDDEAPSADAPVGMFLTYLETRPNGVRIPNRLNSNVGAASPSRAVEFSHAA